MLWHTFTGNPACEYGTEREPFARDIYLNYLKKQRIQQGKNPDDIRIDLPGLMVNIDFPFFGVSPDGIVMIEEEIEEDASSGAGILNKRESNDRDNKKPNVTAKVRKNVKKSKKLTKYLLEIKCPYKKQFYGDIPPYYYCQIRG